MDVMDQESKLNIENLSLKINDKIKYITSISKNYTCILTQYYFYIYDKSKNNLIQHIIPDNPTTIKNQLVEKNKIWTDKFGIHIIFQLEGYTYYFNNILPEKKKIQILTLDNNQPLALCFSNVTKNLKNSDEIIFSDTKSVIYTLNINVEENGEISEKICKIFDMKKMIDDAEIEEEKKSEDAKTNNDSDKLDKLLENNYFCMDKDDNIYDIKMFIKEEKSIPGKKINPKRNYFILAVSKRIIFQFSGKNSINEIFAKYKKENLINIKQLFKDCKIFPKMPKLSLENPRIQIYKKSTNKNYFYWNSEVGFCQWELTETKPNILPFPQKDFNIYKYIKVKLDGSYEKNPCPISCIATMKCIYFLYTDCLIVLNTLTNCMVNISYFKEEKYIDMFYNSDTNKITLYSANKIKLISLEHEYDILWKDYIQRGEYNLAIKEFPYEDEIMISKLHKLNADKLFKEKNYSEAGIEYAKSDENFEHVCLKFLKLNNINYLFNYLLNYKNKKFPKLIKNEKGDESDSYFLQKYLYNTWLLELIFEKQDKKDFQLRKDTLDEKKINNLKLENILYETELIDSDYHLDKLILFDALRNYGRHEDFIFLAGKKNDYKSLFFDLVNHNKFKEAITNIKLYMSFSDEESYLKNLMKIFLIYVNIFTKYLPEESLELVEEYYYLIDNAKDIIRIIYNLDSLYDNSMSEEIFEKMVQLLRKIRDISKNKYKIPKTSKLTFNESDRKNLENLYILYLSKSSKDLHNKELTTYLKSLIKYINNTNIYSINKENNPNKIHFEFSFAENLFKRNKPALALLYSLKKQYNKSIAISFQCSNKNISTFIANSIPDKKKKKEIWLEVFNHYKSNGIKIVEEILQESNGVLTINDILPHLMGNVQLKDIETNLNKCINEYEIKLKKLKMSIKEFADSEEIISKKINRVANYGEKNLSIKLEDINCTICLKNLKEINFYLFPCRHAFDFDCLLNLLFYNENKKIGDDNFKKKMMNIKKIFKDIEAMNKISFNLSKKKTVVNNISKNQKGFLKSLTIKNNVEDYNKIEPLINSGNKSVDEMMEELDEILNEECPLCGDEVITGTQTKFGDEDSLEWNIELK